MQKYSPLIVMYLVLSKSGDITCKKLASQSLHSNKNTPNIVVISADGILKKEEYIHGFGNVMLTYHHILLYQ